MTKPKTQVTTGKVRFSYLNAFEPRSINGGKPKYSVTLLIPKTDKHTLAKIREAIDAAKATWDSNHSGKKLPAGLKNTVHDGDGDRPSGEPFGDECKDCYVMTISSKRKPQLVYSDKQPITATEELYSGCYGRAIMNFFVFDSAGNKGVSAGLMGLMKLEDGEPLGGGHISDDDWDDDLEDDAAGDSSIFG